MFLMFFHRIFFINLVTVFTTCVAYNIVYSCIYGFCFQNKFIHTRLFVSAAMTAYNPSTVALNNMLRQQLALTTDFIEAQKQLHRHLLGSLAMQHHYTTLEDTKRVSRFSCSFNDHFNCVTNCFVNRQEYHLVATVLGVSCGYFGDTVTF